MNLPTASRSQLELANLQRHQLLTQLQAYQSGEGHPKNTSLSAVVAAAQLPKPAPVPTTLLPVDHLKALGLYRFSVRVPAVRTGYQVKTHRVPFVFPCTPDTRLSRLSRAVSPLWVNLLTSISSASLSGGKCFSSQGRNLITIVQEVRKRCYLRVTKEDVPLAVREQVVLTVDGERHCFARACGMSPRTFYRALRHPLAHLFLRTQKVQRERDGQRENVATLFSVNLYEPEGPVDLETLCYAESVEQEGVLVVPDSICQDDGTKDRPGLNQIQREPVDNLTAQNPGLSVAARNQLQQTLDSALLGSPARAAFDHSSEKGSAAAGARAAAATTLEIATARRPDYVQLARDMADFHDAPEHREMATVGYYKALMHLDLSTVLAQVGVIARWLKQGQCITNSGALLMSLLNRKTRAKTGFNIRDLGLEPT